MREILKKIEPFFSYSKRERNGFFILFVIMVLLLGLKHYLLNVHDYSEELAGTIVLEGASVAEVSENLEVPKKEKAVVKIAKVSLNSLDPNEWSALKGIGPVLSNRIVKFNKLLGGYYSREQIREVYGIDSILFGQIEEHIELSSAPWRKIDINIATLDEVKKHPYLSAPKSKQILAYRDQKIRIESIQDLLNDQVISKQEFERIRNYLETN